MKRDNLAHGLRCIDFTRGPRDDTKICGFEPWLEVIKYKINSSQVSSTTLIYVKTSWLRRIISRILGLSVIRSEKGRDLIGYITGDGRTHGEIIIKLDSRDWFNIYAHRLPRILALPLSELERVVLYLAINTSGIFINLSTFVLVYNALYGRIYDSYLRNIASISGFEVSVVYNFALNELITFRRTGLERTLKAILGRLGRFHLASLSSWASQLLMVNILPSLLGIEPWIAQFIGILIGFILNFILGYIYTWSRHRLRH